MRLLKRNINKRRGARHKVALHIRKRNPSRLPSRLSRFRSRLAEKQCKCRRHCAAPRAANYPAMFREGDDSRVASVHVHTYIHSADSCNTERARKSDTEGLERRTAQRDAEGCVICEPESATLSPTPRLGGGVLYLALLRRAPLGSGVVLAAPELLTLSVTHFHFIICPLHPRIAPRRPTMLGITLARATRRDPAMETRWIEGHPGVAACDRLTRQGPLEISVVELQKRTRIKI